MVALLHCTLARFFLVDSVGGSSGKEPAPRVVRFLSSLELRVSLLNTRESPDKPGRIHPPLAVLRSEACSSAPVQQTDKSASLHLFCC